jgi:RNA 2',3'-cyclic 3'-phosphodiesterase
MRPNWFFAFPVNGSFVADLPPPPPSFRLFHPEDVHLTLSFLGGCGEDAAQRALRALDESLPPALLAPLDVSLGEVVPMGPQREYSALSALLQRGREQTEACIAQLRDVLSEAALGRRDKRTPKAHITVARPGSRVTEAGRAQGLAWASSLDLSAIATRLERIALYTWSEGNRRERLFRVVAERKISRANQSGPSAAED